MNIIIPRGKYKGSKAEIKQRTKDYILLRIEGVRTMIARPREEIE